MGPMSETGAGKLEALLTLHRMDLEIARTERELRESVARLAALEESVTRLEEELAQVGAELADRRKEIRAVERTLEEKQVALARARAKVDAVQNQRQYSAATVEYELVKRDLHVLEDRALELLQRAEELEAGRRDLAARLEIAQVEATPKREGLIAERDRMEALLATQRQQRTEEAERIDSQILRMYDRIRASRSDVAMAPLTKDGACGHCYTAVTIQQRLEIRSLSRIVRCEGCGVILYPEPSSG